MSKEFVGRIVLAYITTGHRVSGAHACCMYMLHVLTMQTCVKVKSTCIGYEHDE